MKQRLTIENCPDREQSHVLLRRRRRWSNNCYGKRNMSSPFHPPLSLYISDCVKLQINSWLWLLPVGTIAQSRQIARCRFLNSFGVTILTTFKFIRLCRPYCFSCFTAIHLRHIVYRPPLPPPPPSARAILKMAFSWNLELVFIPAARLGVNWVKFYTLSSENYMKRWEFLVAHDDDCMCVQKAQTNQPTNQSTNEWAPKDF